MPSCVDRCGNVFSRRERRGQMMIRVVAGSAINREATDSCCCLDGDGVVARTGIEMDSSIETAVERVQADGVNSIAGLDEKRRQWIDEFHGERRSRVETGHSR